jgi:hypothetical protein
MKIFQSSPATEWRPKVAHGETVGCVVKTGQAPERGERNFRSASRCHFRSEGTSEISQLRSGWRPAQNIFQVLKGRRTFSAVPSGRNFLRAVFQTLRVWLISGGRSATQFALTAMLLFFAVGAAAETTNTLSDAEIQGRKLAQQLCEAKPVADKKTINTGTLTIRDGKGIRSEIAIRVQIWANDVAYSTIYESTSKTNQISLAILHFGEDIHYALFIGSIAACETNKPLEVNERQTMIPFADSDFWLCDLGLEFFHWPQQKVLKREFHRQCSCTVLESTNPNPSTNGYSRVVSWIDNDSLGIVEAYAYDADGKKLKNFYPKNFEKGTNGQWQVQSLIMDNLQTGSRSRLEFDLKK